MLYISFCSVSGREDVVRPCGTKLMLVGQELRCEGEAAPLSVRRDQMWWRKENPYTSVEVYPDVNIDLGNGQIGPSKVRLVNGYLYSGTRVIARTTEQGWETNDRKLVEFIVVQ